MDWKLSLEYLWDVLLQEILAVFISIFLFEKIKKSRIEKKYGGWSVIIIQDKEEKVRRAVSANKTKVILEEPADKVVFLKGVASPYGKITCDLLDEGLEKGVFIEDSIKKEFIIDFDKQGDGNSKSTGLGIL